MMTLFKSKKEDLAGNRKARFAHMIMAVAVSLTVVAFAPRCAFAAHKGDGALDDAAHVEMLHQNLRQNYIRGLMKMTEQFSAVMMQQMEILGAFLDAKHQLETQALFQEIEALAHKEFHPDVEMCVIGTNVRSLAASERKSKVNARILNEIMLDRELLSKNAITADGGSSDIVSRYKHFAKTYCDKADFNGELGDAPGLKAICQVPPDKGRFNNDIDFTRLLDTRLTLDIDLTDTTLTEDEEDVMALTKNLFAHDVFSRIPPEELMQEFAGDEYQDVRSVIALRGVVRNSWSHLVGMRASGTPEAADFLHALVKEMGVPDGEVEGFIGENPSYFAQMEFLTKKLYQNPDFYTNLYTKPVNVERTGVALQAVGLMHNRDRYENALRKEMLVSILLEMKLRDLQEDIDDELSTKIKELHDMPF